MPDLLTFAQTNGGMDTVKLKLSFLDIPHQRAHTGGFRLGFAVFTTQLARYNQIQAGEVAGSFRVAASGDVRFGFGVGIIVFQVGSVRYMGKGEAGALKITRASDLAALNLKPCSRDIFCGTGYDVHALEKGAGIVLGGVQIPCEFALIAHSDGDVAIHALIDAICGAAMLGDIGELFPDSDAKFKGADSKELLRKVMRRVRGYGYELVNADITIIAQRPKIGAYKAQMQEVLSEILNCARVNVKATTTERLGFTGRSEGIAAQAAVNLKFYDWQKHAAKAQDV